MTYVFNVRYAFRQQQSRLIDNQDYSWFYVNLNGKLHRNSRWELLNDIRSSYLADTA